MFICRKSNKLEESDPCRKFCNQISKFLNFTKGKGMVRLSPLFTLLFEYLSEGHLGDILTSHFSLLLVHELQNQLP